MSCSDNLFQLWLNPPASFRGAPFWAWNSELDPDRLCRQIEEMHGAGLGGFFMHSRYGLKTPYLSAKWFECISACIEKARGLGMKAYLYDEDRWPSGSAGGLVTRENKAFRAQVLTAHKCETVKENGEQALFEVEFNDEGLVTSYRKLDSKNGQMTKSESSIIAFDAHEAEPTAWHNDSTYPDTLAGEPIAEFIKTTYETYKKYFSGDFGKVIPAIFSDEPNYYNPWQHHKKLPWTRGLPEEFRSRCGYDLLACLPELVFQSEKEFSKARYDYYRTITDLFVEHFSRQVGNWCERNHIALTGHMLLEETLESQVCAVGAVMPHYEYMQWPGVDMLFDQADELITAKQCGSVAAQLGKERTLSELYGCTGWDWTLEGHKFVGDWQYAIGINFRCLHLSHYSLAGGAKRDYPASISAHSPWWKYYRTVEEYFGRLSLLLTQGSPVRDVLVIHPVQSAWGLYNPVNEKQGKTLTEIQTSLEKLAYTLSGEHYDWDFADESLIAKYAHVSHKKFSLGKMDYKLIIIPPLITLRSATVELLNKFIAEGGKVLILNGMPTHMDGELTDQNVNLIDNAQICSVQIENFLPAIESVLKRLVSITENGAEQRCIWYMLRKMHNGYLLFLQSHDRKNQHRLRIRVEGQTPVVLWDALSGKKHQIKTQEDNNDVIFDLTLSPTGSALLTLGNSVSDVLQPPPETTVVSMQAFAGPFDIELNEDNSMPLDYCSFRLGQDKFSEPMPTLKADASIRKRFGLGPRLGREQQPWYLYANGVVDTAPREPLEMQWHFHVTDLPAKCLLAVENPGDYQIAVNGRPVHEVKGFWIDEDIKTIDITQTLHLGENEIRLSCVYRPDMELEDIYLVGDFGVASLNGRALTPENVTMVKRPKQLQIGPWMSQGLDFYGGSVRYLLELERPSAGLRFRLDLSDIACTAAAIHVGERTIVLPWAPFAADITDAMTAGHNKIAVEIIGGRKNILGPLHTPWIKVTGPDEFNPENPNWQDEYQLNVHGLLGPIVVETLR